MASPALVAAGSPRQSPTRRLRPMTALRHNRGSSLGASLGSLSTVQTMDTRLQWSSQPSLFRSQTVLCLHSQGGNILCSQPHVPPLPFTSLPLANASTLSNLCRCGVNRRQFKYTLFPDFNPHVSALRTSRSTKQAQ